MAYIPPRYGPRDDWRQMLRNGGSYGPSDAVNSWVTDMVMVFNFTEDEGMTPAAAWQRLSMTYDRATKAFSGAPPTPTNASGLIPPAIAHYVFGRALAKEADPAYPPVLYLDHSIHVDRDATEATFKAPRYRPRSDWQQRLETMHPAAGTWQADLVRYWTLRRQDKHEDEAWEAVAMSPANARLALIEDQASDDSGLIPCLPDGTETVARRVLARSAAAAAKLNPEDIYNGLRLDPPV